MLKDIKKRRGLYKYAEYWCCVVWEAVHQKPEVLSYSRLIDMGFSKAIWYLVLRRTQGELVHFLDLEKDTITRWKKASAWSNDQEIVFSGQLEEQDVTKINKRLALSASAIQIVDEAE